MNALDSLLRNCTAPAAEKRRSALDDLHKFVIDEALSSESITNVLTRAVEFSKSKSSDTLRQLDAIEICSLFVYTSFDTLVFEPAARNGVITVLTHSLKSKDEDVRIFGAIAWRWLANRLGDAFRRSTAGRQRKAIVAKREKISDSETPISHGTRAEEVRRLNEYMNCLLEFWQAALKVLKASAFDKYWGLGRADEQELLDVRLKNETWSLAIELDDEVEKLTATFDSIEDEYSKRQHISDDDDDDDDGSPLIKKVRRARGKPRAIATAKRRASAPDALTLARNNENKARMRRESTPKNAFRPFCESDMNGNDQDINGNEPQVVTKIKAPQLSDETPIILETNSETEPSHTAGCNRAELQADTNTVVKTEAVVPADSDSSKQTAEVELQPVHDSERPHKPLSDLNEPEAATNGDPAVTATAPNHAEQSDTVANALSTDSASESAACTAKWSTGTPQRSPEPCRTSGSNWDSPSTKTSTPPAIALFGKFESPSSRNSSASSKQSIVSSRTHAMVNLARKRTFADANTGANALVGSPTARNEFTETESPARKLLALAVTTPGSEKQTAGCEAPTPIRSTEADEVSAPAVLNNCEPPVEQAVTNAQDAELNSNSSSGTLPPAAAQADVPPAAPSYPEPLSALSVVMHQLTPMSAATLASPRSILKRSSFGLPETPNGGCGMTENTDAFRPSSPSMPSSRTVLFSPCTNKQFQAARSRIRASLGQGITSLASGGSSARRSLAADSSSNWNWHTASQSDSASLRRSLTFATATPETPTPADETSMCGSAARRSRRVCFAEEPKVAYYDTNSTSTTIHYANGENSRPASVEVGSTQPRVDHAESGHASSVPESATNEHYTTTEPTTLADSKLNSGHDAADENVVPMADSRRRRQSLIISHMDGPVSEADVQTVAQPLADAAFGVGELISEPLALQPAIETDANACTTPPRALPDADADATRRAGRACTFPDPDVLRRDTLPPACSPRSVGRRRAHSVDASNVPIDRASPLEDCGSTPATPIAMDTETQSAAAEQPADGAPTDIAVTTACEPFGEAVAFVSPPAFAVTPADSDSQPAANTSGNTSDCETVTAEDVDALASATRLAAALSNTLMFVSQQKASSMLDCESDATRTRLCQLWRLLNGAQATLTELFAPVTP